MANVVIGVIGSDAGYWVLTPHGLKHVGGYNPEAMVQVNAAVRAVSAATQIKNGETQQGIATAAGHALHGPVQQIAEAFVKGASAAAPQAAAGSAGPTIVVLNLYGG